MGKEHNADEYFVEPFRWQFFNVGHERDSPITHESSSLVRFISAGGEEGSMDEYRIRKVMGQIEDIAVLLEHILGMVSTIILMIMSLDLLWNNIYSVIQSTATVGIISISGSIVSYILKKFAVLFND